MNVTMRLQIIEFIIKIGVWELPQKIVVAICNGFNTTISWLINVYSRSVISSCSVIERETIFLFAKIFSTRILFWSKRSSIKYTEFHHVGQLWINFKTDNPSNVCYSSSTLLALYEWWNKDTIFLQYNKFDLSWTHLGLLLYLVVEYDLDVFNFISVSIFLRTPSIFAALSMTIAIALSVNSQSFMFELIWLSLYLYALCALLSWLNCRTFLPICHL